MTLFLETLEELTSPSSFQIVGDDTYDNVNWFIDNPPTKEDVESLYQQKLDDYFSQEYARRRAAEYPPITEYIDGIVKGDQAQIDKYIAECLAVKSKYPKPVE